MRVSNYFKDNISDVPTSIEIGEWGFKINGENNKSIDSIKLSQYLSEISKSIPWIRLKSIEPSFVDEKNNLIYSPWNNTDAITYIEWFKNLKIDKKIILNSSGSICNIFCDVIVFDENNQKHFLDACYIQFDFEDFGEGELSFFINLSTNIFSTKIWTYNNEKSERVNDIELGENIVENNRENLMESLQLLEKNLNATIEDYSTNSMTNIYKYGFTNKTQQYSFK